jgi:hypothetical protein
MRIIFVKDYIDKESFDTWVEIKAGEEAFLVDETIGRVEISEGFDREITLMGVPAGSYSEKRNDIED